MQIIILLSLIAWSFIHPSQNLALLISIGLIIATASATGYNYRRSKQINEHEASPWPQSK